MKKLVLSRRWLLAALLALGLAIPAAGWPGKGGNGKGGGGGEDPPPDPPPIYYEVTYIAPPSSALNIQFNDLNDLGMSCGHYTNESNIQSAWLCDPAINANSAIDLNDLPITGLDPAWYIRSAVGLNNNGLVVGYAALIEDPSVRRGYVLDLTEMHIYELPDGDLGYTYARKVNDKGDILGTFVDADGLWNAYLFNPGLRGVPPDEQIEIISKPLIDSGSVSLSNPPNNLASMVVFASDDGTGVGTPNTYYEYVRGGNLLARTDLPNAWSPIHINDYGDIASNRRVYNKSGTRSTTYVWRETLTYEEWEFDERVIGFNNAGTILTSNSIFHDDYGFVPLADLLNTAITFGGVRYNNVGPLGFGEIAGSQQNPETGVWQIYYLTPVEIQF